MISPAVLPIPPFDGTAGGERAPETGDWHFALLVAALLGWSGATPATLGSTANPAASGVSMPGNTVTAQPAGAEAIAVAGSTGMRMPQAVAVEGRKAADDMPGAGVAPAGTMPPVTRESVPPDPVLSEPVSLKPVAVVGPATVDVPAATGAAATEPAGAGAVAAAGSTGMRMPQAVAAEGRKAADDMPGAGVNLPGTMPPVTREPVLSEPVPPEPVSPKPVAVVGPTTVDVPAATGAAATEPAGAGMDPGVVPELEGPGETSDLPHAPADLPHEPHEPADPPQAPAAGPFEEGTPADDLGTAMPDRPAAGIPRTPTPLPVHVAHVMREAVDAALVTTTLGAGAVEVAVVEGAEGTEVALRLDPPDLGEVRVSLRWSDGVLYAALSASDPSVGSLLAGRAAELVAALAAAGVEVAGLEVDVGGWDSGSGSRGTPLEPGTPAPGGSRPPRGTPARGAAVSGRLDLRV